MAEIDPISGKPISSQQPDEVQPAQQPMEDVTPTGELTPFEQMFGHKLSPEENKKFNDNLLKMIQSEIQRMQKKAKEAAKHMKDVIEGRE